LEDQPLGSSELSKIFVFILLMIPAVGFGVGVIPALFLIFGIVMMKRDNDFSHITTAVRNCRIYLKLGILVGIGFLLLSAYAFSKGGSDADDILIVAFLFMIIPSIVYSIFIAKLFYSPLYTHKNWVASNGIFAHREIEAREPGDIDVNIIKGGNLKSYSVAEELLKWAKLKEDGHISEAEYEKAKSKLLDNN